MKEGPRPPSSDSVMFQENRTRRQPYAVFQNVADKMPILYEALVRSPLRFRSNLVGIAARGIYVFYENGKPLYVGRSNKLRQRILEHGRKSSDQYSASFAFRLAKEEAERGGVELKGTRADWEKNERFARLFGEARERVAKMAVRVVEVSDPVEQTMFEVYSALRLGSPYNDFDTH
jgi:hypothetical protein